MMNRRTFLAAGATLAAAPAWGKDLPTLKALGATKGIMVGAATATWQLRTEGFPALLAREAAITVPDYEMKRKFIEPSPGRYDFSAVDSIFAYARGAGLKMRGHPLVWHEENPAWLEEAVARRRDPRILTGYIQTVMSHYRGRMVSVDVVNEAIADDGGGLRSTLWLKAFGPGYLDMAFHAAAAADPGVLRVYNDWGLEEDSRNGERKRAALLDLLDGLLRRRVPVQAIGLQGHLAAFGPHVAQAKLHAFLNELAARNMAILVTELDVEDSGGPSDFALRDRAVADETRRFLDVVLDNSATRTLVSWDLTDKFCDPPSDRRLRAIGWRGRKLPYDDRFQRKPMWHAMARSLAGARSRL
jgi:endo-1,4-beta-xylanase